MLTKMEKRIEAILMIEIERQRQDARKMEGRFKYTCADPEMENYERFAVLGEEFGEVAIECLSIEHTRELRGGAGGTPEALRHELAQVAAVCMAWIEGLL